MADSGTIHMIFWLLVLVFLSFWVAGICFFPFTIVSLFVPCIPDLKALSDLLLKGVTFPYICSDNMGGGKKCPRVFLWLLCLFFVSFFIAGISFFFFCLIQCFIPCCKCLEPLGEVLMKGICFPKFCVEKMIA